MLFLTGGRFREVHFQEPKITETQWNRIAELSGLPQDARPEIQDCIGLYRQLRRDAEHEYPRLSKMLSATRDRENKALENLRRIVANRNFLPTLAMGLDGQDEIPEKELGSIRDWLEQTCEEKQKLVDWYKSALERLHHRKRGPKGGRSSLFSRVYLLNAALDTYTGAKLSRSKRRTDGRNYFDYVLEVCRIAEPSLRHRSGHGVSSVEEVVKQVVKDYRADEDSFEIPSWEALIPNWKPATHFVAEEPKLGIRLEFHKEGTSSHWSFSSSGQTPKNKIRIMFPIIEPFVPKDLETVKEVTTR
jgi:hypothetical protein